MGKLFWNFDLTKSRFVIPISLSLLFCSYYSTGICSQWKRVYRLLADCIKFNVAELKVPLAEMH